MVLDIVASLAGLIIPPAYDFIKKKFIKGENDTPEATAGTLATTKPEILPEYVKSIATLKEAEKNYFNRDVVGEVSPWVRDLRACIRPLTVAAALICLFLDGLTEVINLDPGARATFEMVVTSWMGDRFKLRTG